MDKEALLALLREHLTVSVDVDRTMWSLDQTVKVQILFDGEPVTDGSATIYWPSAQEQGHYST
jgi:hypothetical protein